MCVKPLPFSACLPWAGERFLCTVGFPGLAITVLMCVPWDSSRLLRESLVTGVAALKLCGQVRAQEEYRVKGLKYYKSAEGGHCPL